VSLGLVKVVIGLPHSMGVSLKFSNLNGDRIPSDGEIFPRNNSRNNLIRKNAIAFNQLASLVKGCWGNQI
jgi:hypothetical protein